MTCFCKLYFTAALVAEKIIIHNNANFVPESLCVARYTYKFQYKPQIEVDVSVEFLPL